MKPTKDEVLKNIIDMTFHFQSEGVATAGSLAKSLKTTPYFINKQIRLLVEEELLSKGVRSGGFCEESEMPYPPLKGYMLTEQAKETELYKELKAEKERIFEECFGFSGEPF